MKEVSNKVLMYVLFVAVVVSVGSTMYTLGVMQTESPTGMATTEGTVDVEITSTYVVNVTDTTINYGSGTLSESAEACVLKSTSPKPTCWVNSSPYASDPTIAFENVGNQAIDVEINGTPIENFVGGGGYFQANCTCTSGSAGTNLNISSTHQDCCTNLLESGSDTGTLNTLLNVTTTSSTGAQQANLYFYATSP